MAQLLTVRLNKSDQQPLGFRLQGGKDFGTPLVVQKVNGGSAAERAGLQAGDALIRVNNTDVYNLRHQEAQDAIRAAGVGLELTVQRGGGTWRPTVTPTGSLPRPGTRPLGGAPAPVTTTSLKATPQPSRNFGSGHNSVAKPFGYMNGNGKQYNSPVNMYSDKTIAETLSAQTEVLAGGVLGVNFKKNEKTYDAEKSAVFKVLQEEQNDPEPEGTVAPVSPAPVSGLRHVPAPVTKPDAPLNTGGLPPGQNICEECERLITGVFVRIKDKNLHVECFKCSTCGSSLKNQGYYNINGKLYCDIHAKLVARQNPPAPNLEPVTVPPGGRIPANSYSTPLPPLATNNYTNGSSAMFSPSSNLSSSGPKPFGSSLGSAYSPSLSPRSAPLSPARPVTAPAPAPVPAPAPAPAPAPFAPTQNVKSIVWPPPPNPPDDDNANPNNIGLEPMAENKGLLIKNENDGFQLGTVSNQHKSSEMVSSEQTAAYSSNVSFSSASMSTATTASSQSASMVQSSQSGFSQETKSCVESFTKHASSQNQSISVFETQINPKDFIQLSLKNPMDNFMNNPTMASTKEESSKTEAFMKTQSSKGSMTVNEEKQFSSIGSAMMEGNKKLICDTGIKPAFLEQSPIKLSETTQEIKTGREQKLQFIAEEEQTQRNFTGAMPEPLNIAAERRYPSINPTPGSDLLSCVQTSNVQSQSKTSKNFEQKRANPSKPVKTPVPSRQSSDKAAHKSSSEFKKDTASLSGQNESLKRGSLLDALTIAPERPYSPLRLSNIPSYYTSTSSEPNKFSDDQFQMPSGIPLESSRPIEDNQCLLPQTKKDVASTSVPSAFKPIPKQVFPPPKPEEFEALSSFGSTSERNQSKFQQTNQGNFETMMAKTESESCAVTTSSTSHGFSSVKTTQNYFEQQNRNQSLSSTSAMPPSSYQNVMPEMYKAPEITTESKINQSQQVNQTQQGYKDTTAMTFQPVKDLLRDASPVRSRPTTPSLINKPAPIIPHYQMNLVTMEHSAPKSQVYEPSSTEASRSSTPMLRSRSPGQGIQGSNLKAHAPRIKDSVSQKPMAQTSTKLGMDSEKIHKNYVQNVNPPFTTQAPEQPTFMSEARDMNMGYEVENKDNSMFNQNYAQKEMQSHNITEYGTTTMESTKKTYEEFQQMQSAKFIEIKKGGSKSCDSFQQLEPNIRPSNISKQVFPPPLMSLPATYENVAPNITNENVATANRQSEIYKPIPSISGANQGPVCDPTPSTGSSVGGAARGKAFGVSSAPKRGRGVLNKAVMPGSRVPLCGSCNGNIRGPFITALGRIWCPEHFVCVNATCRRQLQDIGFVEENGQLYCEFCFEQYIAPACDKCHAKIKGDCLNAIGKHFHPECFNCVYCGKLFGNNPFFLEDGLPYCEADWNELFTTKCFACGFPVEAGDRWVEALNNNYHSQCFNCTVCKKNLEGQSFFARGGRPYCRIHAR